MTTTQAPDALRLVPAEPTEAMLKAMDTNNAGYRMGLGLDFMRDVWTNALEAAPAVQPAAGREEVTVRAVEMVSYESGYEETAPSIWRIEINGVCADFETETAANNFRDAILAALSAPQAAPGEGEQS